MFNKIKTLANAFLSVGIVFGIIALFQIPKLDLLNFRIRWIAFVLLVFMAILFTVLGISFKCIEKQFSEEIQSIYKYYDKKIKDSEDDR